MSLKETWTGLRWPIKAVIIGLFATGAFFGLDHFNLIPGLKSVESQDVGQFKTDNVAINNTDETAMLPVPNPDDAELAELQSPQVRLMNWVWFGNAGVFSANGGLNTTKGSLMEKYGVNLKMITNNSVADMKREQLAFITDYAKGNRNSTQGVHFVTLMGDGAPAYISAMNAVIEKEFGKEYCLKIAGIVGFSLGEDCVMGPVRWKADPQSLKSAVVSAVIGDGDWGILVRYAADNGIKVNPDPTTYDPNAINFVPAPEDDFMKAAEEVIANRTVELKEKDANGKLTGKKVTKTIEGAATWFPGDLQIIKKTDLVKLVSTKEYSNQMGTVVVGCDKWMKENNKTVVNFLSASLTASNQIKQYDKWFKYACTLAPKVFCANPEDCSESTEDWYKYARSGGYDTKNTAGDVVSIGGTQMANLSDNKKYFGIKGGNNYYQSVYNYFSGVMKDLNPAGFMDNVSKLTPYEEAVDLSYLRQVNLDANNTGTSAAVDYSTNKGQVFAKRNWQIQFMTGSTDVSSMSEGELKAIFDALNIAGTAKVRIIGHTDNVGNPESNQVLSEGRARAVKKWLMEKSNGTFPSERFSVEGRGQDEPVADNNTAAGKAQNRRVEIQLLQ